MELKCPKCGSEYVYVSKKKNINICEDCGNEFNLEKKFIPQKVFMSYGHDENKEVVEYIYNKLKERGHEPWIDKSNIKYGDDWRNSITSGILDSNGFLAFISKHSVRVPGVSLDEISIAVGNYNCRIQPILLEKNVMPPNTICNIQFIDMSDWKDIKNNSSELEYSKWIDDKINAIFEIIENEKIIELSGNISFIEKKLEPLTNSLKLRSILKNEIVHRKWLVDLVKKKVENKSKSIILYGTPGTGKSVLSAYLSNFSPDCIASFFCEWNNSLSYNTIKFLKSIIFQLSCYIEDYQKIVIEKLKNDNISNKSVDEIILEYIKKPLGILIDGNRPNKMIILDALDEAVGANNEFIDVVLKFIDSLPEWITVLITTRPENGILDKLKYYDSINIDDYSDLIKNDIEEYITRRIDKNEISSKIISKSDGSFVYAKELIELYNIDKANIDFDNIPKGLSGIYYANFNRIFKEYDLYQKFSKKIFEVLIAAKEQMNIDLVMEILDIDEYEFNNDIKNISSYVYKMKRDNNYYLQVFHKSFLDFIITDDAGKYRISKKDGDRIIFNYLLKCVANNININEYLMKYALCHISTNDYEELDNNLKISILKSLSKSSSVFGDLKMEEFYLNKIKNDFSESKLYYKSALEYYKKISGSKLIEIANKALEFAKLLNNEDERFDLIGCISFAYFYSGYSEKSYNLINEERKKHDERFWEKDFHDADYYHAISVTAHDLDKNNDVIEAAKKDVKTYKSGKKFYNQYISMVNLMDGYMAVGNLKEADNIAMKVFEHIDNRYFVHVDDILQICYANLLQTENRIMESLDYYERGLKIAKDIQSWDYIYGSIWRELAIIKFNDISAFNNLKKYRELAIKADYKYLISLADTFLIIFYYKFNNIDFNKKISVEVLLNEIKDYGFPGHILQSLICIDLINNNHNNEMEIIQLLSRCNGVKGMPEVIYEYFKKNEKDLKHGNINVFDDWINSYVNPILEYRKNYFNECTYELDDDIYLCNSHCEICQSKCCYDGVYITEEEEKNIIKFVEEYKTDFGNIKDSYIVDGDWPGMRSKRKTEKVEKNDYDESFPKHFTKTKCIFELDNGECQLQKVATNHQLHPWKVKPRACWLFPIRITSNGNIIPPLTNKDKDVDYIDENYPGYATFMPCVVKDKNGVLWYNKYYNEISYYKFLNEQNKTNIS